MLVGTVLLSKCNKNNEMKYIMETTHNMTPPGNCGINIQRSMVNMLRVQLTPSTLEKTLGKGVYLNPLTVRNGLEKPLWDV